MNVTDVVDKLGLEILAGEGNLDNPVTGGYAADLLSCTMARARKGNVWVTMQSHPNVAAVASLLELAAVIVTEGRVPESETISKANEQKIPILSTPFTTYGIVAALARLGVEGIDQE